MLEHPGQTLGALVDSALEPLFQRPSRLGPDSAWYGHLPFANWIMRAMRPSVLVELGTHAGVSYSGFCDAVLAYHLPTRCFAIDTWQGDEHAGFYGEAVFTDFVRFHDQRYGGFSRLLRCRFDAALALFADGTATSGPSGGIDLLHIDGRHLLSDITSDFNDWLPKLSERAVLLLHDTNVRERDFGVWRFWAELRTRYPSFEFLHTHGLGVLAVGRQVPEAILELCRLDGSPEAGILRERFALAGERWETEFSLGRCSSEIAALRQHDQENAARVASAAASETELASLRQRLIEADIACRARTVELGLSRSELAEARAARHQTARQASLRVAALERMLEAEALTTRRLSMAQLEASRVLADREARLERHAAVIEEQREALSFQAQELSRQAGALAKFRNAPFRRLKTKLGAALSRMQPREIHAPPPAPQIEAPQNEAPQLPLEPQDPESCSRELNSQELAAEIATPAPPWRQIRHVMFVMGEPGTPGATYRCGRNAAACRDAGYEAETVALYDVNPENLARADLLVLWRASMSQHVETMISLARAAGTRIAFDVDDLMIRPELARIEIIDGIRTIDTNETATKSYFSAMLQTMMAADFCIATTEELASEMRRQRDVVHVLPNVFDAATLGASRYGRRLRLESGDDGHVRIGYAGGTRTHQRDFGLVVSALARVLRARSQSRLVLFRERDNQRPLLQMEEFAELAALSAQIEWRDMVPLEQLPAELARLDISLCPLETGNPFCEAKSELKYFEAALAGACTVASPTGPYRRAIRDGVTGFLAADAQSWETILLDLVDDPGRRARVARDAYHDVLWRFGPRRQSELAHGLLAALDQVGSGPTAARSIELAQRRGDYLGRGLPEIPDSEVLFAHDALGEAEITVVMTSYNYEQHIIEALDSVRAQTIADLDLAVVDDGSSDQSVPLVVEWAKRHRDRFNRIRILRTVRNAGLGGARNVVFDAAETPWLMALDSDNRLLPAACETLLAALRASPQAAFAYPRIQQFGGAEMVMGQPHFDPIRLQTGNYIDAMAMVAKWAWAAAGGYYVRRDAMGWEDFDLWLSLTALGQFGIAVPEILAEYRVHRDSMVNAITEQSDNKRTMVEFVEARHPWLRLRTRTANPRAAA